MRAICVSCLKLNPDGEIVGKGMRTPFCSVCAGKGYYNRELFKFVKKIGVGCNGLCTSQLDDYRGLRGKGEDCPGCVRVWHNAQRENLERILRDYVNTQYINPNVVTVTATLTYYSPYSDETFVAAEVTHNVRV